MFLGSSRVIFFSFLIDRLVKKNEMLGENKYGKW